MPGEAPSDWAGRTIDGRYCIESLLGAGGMGEVYRARQLNVDRDVAIKVVHRRRMGDDAATEQLLQEAQVVSRLTSPHSVTLHDVGRVDAGDIFFVTELLEGRTLRQQLSDEGALEPMAVLEVLDGVAQAVGEAHARGLVHRDIKPSNVMLASSPGHDAFVKVLDFGLAAPVQAEDAPRLAGTPAYLAPEVIAGQAPSPRADVYALGVLWFELMRGHPPYLGSKQEVLWAHLDAPLPDVATLPMPASARVLLRRCLAKNPRLRPRDARSFRRQLLDAFGQRGRALQTVEATAAPAANGSDTQTTMASMTTATGRLVQPRRSTPKAWPVAAVALSVAGAGLAVFFTARSPATPGTPPADAPEVAPTSEPPPAYDTSPADVPTGTARAAAGPPPAGAEEATPAEGPNQGYEPPARTPPSVAAPFPPAVPPRATKPPRAPEPNPREKVEAYLPPATRGERRARPGPRPAPGIHEKVDALLD
ncbi:MAG: protein kinase [Myxococcota bacterium]